MNSEVLLFLASASAAIAIIGIAAYRSVPPSKQRVTKATLQAPPSANLLEAAAAKVEDPTVTNSAETSISEAPAPFAEESVPFSIPYSLSSMSMPADPSAISSISNALTEPAMPAESALIVTIPKRKRAARRKSADGTTRRRVKKSQVSGAISQVPVSAGSSDMRASTEGSPFQDPAAA